MVLKGGSPAIHTLGNIGRDEDDYVRVYYEEKDYYIGNFEEGFGFIDVKFMKTDVRSLTEQEIEEVNKKWYVINNTPYFQLSFDKDGYAKGQK
jgi:hypothetical protein